MNYILLLWPNRIRYSLINKLIDCNQNEWVDIVDTHNISFADSSACLLPCAMQCAMLPCAELFRPPPSAFCLCLRDSSSCSLSDADQSDVGPVMRLHNGISCDGQNAYWFWKVLKSGGWSSTDGLWQEKNKDIKMGNPPSVMRGGDTPDYN